MEYIAIELAGQYWLQSLALGFISVAAALAVLADTGAVRRARAALETVRVATRD